MLEPISMRLRNFVTHRDTKLNLRHRGTLLTGFNGTGKSVLVDAFSWCPYGETVRGASYDQVIGLFGDWASVNQKWRDTDSGDLYSITRYRNHPREKNRVTVKINGVDATKVTDIKKTGTNNFIKRLFGLDAKAFMYSVIFSQDRGSICDEKDTERRALLSHIIGLDRIDGARKKADEDRKETKKRLQQADMRITALETELHHLKKSVKERKSSVRDAQLQSEKRSKSMKEHNQSVKKRRKRLQKEIAEVETKVSSLIGARQAQVEAARKLAKAMDKLDVHRKKKTDLALSLHAMTTLRHQINKEIDACQWDEGSICPTCKQVVAAEHSQQQEARLKIRLQELRAECALKDAEHQASEKELNAQSVLVANLRKKVMALGSDVAPMERHLKSLKRELKSAKKLDITDKDDQANIAKLQAMNESDIKRRGVLKIELSDLEDTRQMHVANLKIAEFWHAGFGNKGLKSYIINGTLRTLQEQCNSELEIMTGGVMSVQWESEYHQKNKRVVDKLMLMLHTPDQKTREYHICSKGEKAAIWLCMELALNNLSRSRINMALIDECFDGLDRRRVKEAVGLVSGEKDKRKLVCISHRENIGKYFDTRLNVVLKNGESMLKAA